MCINYLHVWAVLLLAGRFVDARLVDPEYDHLAEGMELSRHIRQGPDDPNPPGQGGNPHRDPGESCDRFTYYADAKGNIQIGDSQCVLPVCSIKGFDTKDDAWVQIGDHCYLFSDNDHQRQSTAITVCQSFGADLASFETAEEMQSVMRKSPSLNKVYYFVSATRDASNDWYWATGVPVADIEWTMNQNPSVAGRPCMLIRAGTRYPTAYPWYCQYAYYYICEYPPTV